MLKYLQQNEKNETRNIYEKVFTEDTKNFLDYYYRTKTIDNKILCKYDKDNIISMLMLNPYNIQIRKNINKSYYIVAVATLEKYRKKGHMRELLYKSINDMYKENIPFCFLRPAKEEIYLPFSFNYIYNHTELCIKDNEFLEEKIDTNDYEEIAKFTNKFLAKRYDLYCKRDTLYIQNLHKEVLSENGDIIKLVKSKKIVGYYVYWGDDRTVRAIFLEEKYTKIKKEKPLVMGRIVNIYSFFENFRLKENKKETIINIELKDDIIKENNGYFKLKVYGDKSFIQKVDILEIDSILTIDIGDMTSLFFGYKPLEIFSNDEKIIQKLDNIHMLDKVFIDEEV